MSERVLVEFNLPRDLKTFQLPAALEKRLQSLLDKQDINGKLPARERREAEALVELSELLSLLKVRARVVRGKGGL